MQYLMGQTGSLNYDYDFGRMNENRSSYLLSLLLVATINRTPFTNKQHENFAYAR
ncbi:hypothetical Protein YC6258_01460 [Gynuella sunshinyii YC6258]|uniref:Uncharacterized protein n=1 Tax=Gynuella sunshinyii YC6258 TaxID=1445510 RepID=A0A0C5VJD2_9GAMM|nr:hypothetical Protein YC6258_01460 [Gynuella sunshinyii YC6258]